MMKKTKKGITLVELVICCAIIVMLGGACSAVLASGSRIFNTSSHTANAQLDANVVQNFMMNLIPSTNEVSQISLNDAKALTDGNCLFFDDENDNLFTVQIDGKKTSVRSVQEFEYEIIRAGDPESDTARAQFIYVITLSDGNTLSGGFVLSNMKYDEGSMPDIKGKVTEDPFYFNKTS